MLRTCISSNNQNIELDETEDRDSDTDDDPEKEVEEIMQDIFGGYDCGSKQSGSEAD